MSPQHVALFAEYNHWMNERLYEAAARLDEAELAADRGAFFGSILGTLNHLAVGDTVWMQRFAAHPPGFASLAEMASLPSPKSLREPMAPDFAGLRAYRARLDGLVLRWADELRPEHLAAPFSFARMSGERMTFRLGDVLLHFFNHQTHHRGQVSTLLSQCGIDIGVTDLIVKLPAVDG
jgi:uncharacterized damage-inducible protein DinB